MTKLNKKFHYNIDLQIPERKDKKNFAEYVLNDDADIITNDFLSNKNLVLDYDMNTGMSFDYVRIYFDAEICTLEQANNICDELIELLNDEKYKYKH